MGEGRSPNEAARLFAASLAAVEWMADAACADSDTSLWFPDLGGNYSAEALDTCRGCPVRRECLDYALDVEETHGLWGGWTPNERRRMRRLQPCDWCGGRFDRRGGRRYCNDDCAGEAKRHKQREWNRRHDRMMRAGS